MANDPFALMESKLLQNGLGHLVAAPEPLQGDGSDRRFYRLVLYPARTIIAVLPPPQAGRGFAEADSAAAITRHLAERGAAVPELLAYEPDCGLLFFEDAGDTHLSDFVDRHKGQDDRLEAVYRPIIDALLQMQIKGAEGFTADLCWDSPRYDRQTMIEREGLYFLDAFCIGYAELEVDKELLLSEISQIVFRIEKIIEKQGDFFLHRDFQSRNIMVLPDGSFRIIDYQAGRLGPLAYDLASLLIDPYVALSVPLQERLLNYYSQQLEARYGLDSILLRESYDLLACMRNLQILGAFSFLSRCKAKGFFAQFIPVALQMLHARMRKPWASNFPALQEFVQDLFTTQDLSAQRFSYE